jgi:hypothetical protein
LKLKKEIILKIDLGCFCCCFELVLVDVRLKNIEDELNLNLETHKKVLQAIREKPVLKRLAKT